MNRHKPSRHFFPSSARTIVASSALSIGLLSLSCPCHTAVAQTGTRAIAQEFPNQNLRENLPGSDVAQYFPKEWKTYASVSGHNAVFPLSASAPDSLKQGVQWSFAGAGAIPLDGPPLDGDFKVTAYTIGMPVGVSVVQGILYVGDANTGKLVWKSDIQSFVSMSSPVAGDGNIFLGGTYPNYFYALDQNTGKIAWKTTIPGLVATGISDCTPAYADGIVIQEATIESGDAAKPVANVVLAMDAKTGRIIWQKRLDDGPVPPAMKTATPMIDRGIVYEGSPVSGNYHAFDLKTGRQLWSVHLGSQIRAGAAVLNGIAYVPYHSGDIAVIRTSDGKLLGQKHIGGSFGPSSPVIVGGTLYVSNVFGWVNAIPLSQFPTGGQR